jgi:dTDP-glucose 4,6-dehydratase
VDRWTGWSSAQPEQIRVTSVPPGVCFHARGPRIGGFSRVWWARRGWRWRCGDATRSPQHDAHHRCSEQTDDDDPLPCIAIDGGHAGILANCDPDTHTLRGDRSQPRNRCGAVWRGVARPQPASNRGYLGTVRNVLVTGGAGFIGSNFVRHLLAAWPNAKVATFDLLTYAGSVENLRELPGAERHQFVLGDIRDREAVDRAMVEHAVDTVVHFAAESHVDRSIASPGDFVSTNVTGTFTLLESARAAWSGRSDVRFHHVSTDEVYGSLAPDAAPVAEDAPYRPRSPYAASKAASDHLVRAYVTTYGFPATLSSCSNNYGPYQFPVYGDGGQIRDWLHVDDHCSAIRRILEDGRIGETYHIGGGNQPTNLEIVLQLCALLDDTYPDSPHRPHRSLIRFVADRPGHDRRYDLNYSKITHELGWQPTRTLADGLRATVAWYAGSGSWLAAIRDSDDYRRWIDLNYAARSGVGQ